MRYVVYISIQGEDKILIYDMDPTTGELLDRREAAAQGGPAPLCTDPDQRHLYCALRAENQLATLAIDAATGGLTRVGTTSLRSDPCYISVDATGGYLFGAYYGAGLCSLHRIGEEGIPSEAGAQYWETHRGAHCIHPDRTNRFVFLPHVMPYNAIHQYIFDADAGTLAPNQPPKVHGAANQGPRHYVYHPTLDMVYTSNEQGCSVSAYRLDPEKGTLTPQQIISTLPSSWEGKNTCAQIHIHPNGRSLYAANRGHDSLAMYALNAKGELEWLGAQPSEKTPRVFNIDPTGKFLYAAGFDSGYLTSYRIEENGRLWPLQRYEVGQKPMWILPLELES